MLARFSGYLLDLGPVQPVGDHLLILLDRLAGGKLNMNSHDYSNKNVNILLISFSCVSPLTQMVPHTAGRTFPWGGLLVYRGRPKIFVACG